MVAANLEYILFAVGVCVILLSLYLSYRLEKDKKEEKEISGELIRQQLVDLKKEINKSDLPRKMDDFYQLIEHNLRTQNSKNDDLKREIKLIKNMVEEKDEQDYSLEKRFDNLLDEIQEVKRNYTDFDEEMNHRLEQQSQKIEELREEIQQLVASNQEFQAEIIDIQEEQKDTEIEPEIPEVQPEQVEEVETETEAEFERDEVQIEEANDEQSVTADSEQLQNSGGDKLSSELAEDKRKKFKKIKELKEAGMEMTDIADRVNMGVREVELFWKVNGPRG